MWDGIAGSFSVEGLILQLGIPKEFLRTVSLIPWIAFKAGESIVDLIPADGKGSGIEI